MASLLELTGLDWAVLDVSTLNFSTLSRRMKTLEIDLPKSATSGPLHLLIDSTGIKVEGEGIMAIDFDRQITEIKARAAVLNTFTILGTPQTKRVSEKYGKGNALPQ